MAGLPAAFFARSALEVAPELLGCLLTRSSGKTQWLGRIVEVEAYLGDGSDPAAHSHRGPTPRNLSMFGPPARFYVYRSMGIHHCINVVCEPKDQASAVLIRALEPLRGLSAMRRLRAQENELQLTSGPGKLCQAFGIDRRFDGASVARGELRLLRATAAPGAILAGPRIGISKATELPYRFFEAENPNVTRSSLNRRANPL